MRIVGGELRGREIAAPRSNNIRPTTDRVRESLFNILKSRYPGLFPGVRVLDLFAGTGALGFEALSRGASACMFVENSVEGRGLIRSTTESLSLQGRAKLLRRDATALGDIGTIKPFGLVFADPPYGKGLGEKALESALAGGWLEPAAIVVVEESASAAFLPIAGFDAADERRYGDTIVRILRAA
jgi:16S rRNA (guanine966-N2)-methyltransferase